MDEKTMLSMNALSKAKLDAAYAKKFAKRSAEMKAVGIMAVEPPGDGVFDGFIALWRKHYPMMVSILGFASFLPWFAGPIAAIRSLLGVINDQIIPILDELD